MPPPVEYTESWGSRLKSLVAVLALGGIGAVLWGMAEGDPLVRGVAGLFVALAALSLLILLARRQARRPRLRLDAEGIHAANPTAAYRFDLAWGEITGVRVELYEARRLVVLDAKKALSDLEDAGETGREERRKHLAALGSWFVVPDGVFGRSPDALRDEIARYWLAALAA